MATIGQSLLEPELGWKRIDNEDVKIIYNGNFITSNSPSHYSGSIKSIENNIKDNSIEFYLKSNRLRLISYVSADNSYSNNVNINIDGVDYTSTLSFSINRYQTLVADINIHNLRTHKIVITDKSNSPRGLNIDAIDIDSDGVLLDKATYYSTIDSMKGMFEGCISLPRDSRIPLHINNIQDLYKNCTGMTHIVSNWKNHFENQDIITRDCYAGCTGIQFVDNQAVEDGLDEIPIAWGGRGFDKTVTGIYKVFIPSDNYVFTLNEGYLMGDKIVKWGDGSTTVGELTHTYRYAGEYTIKGKIQMLSQGTNPCASMSECCTEIVQYPTEGNTSAAFLRFRKVTRINVAGNKLETGIAFCFASCSSLTEIIGLETWDVSNIVDFAELFSATKITNDSFNISNWNLGKARTFLSMFNFCSNLVNPPIINIPDTVINISEMYKDCISLTNIDNMVFGTGITTCTNWISGCRELISADNLTLKTPKLSLFRGNTTVQHIRNINVSSTVISLFEFARDCTTLTEITFSSAVNDTNIESMMWFLYGCNKVTRLDFGGIKFKKCVSFYSWLNTVNLTGKKLQLPEMPDDSVLLNLYEMFGGLRVDEIIFYPKSISSNNMNRITINSSINKIKNLMLNNYTFVEAESKMFDCELEHLSILSQSALKPFKNSEVKKVTNLTIGSEVTDISSLFEGCTQLTHDISIPPHITNCTNTFKGCTAMTHIQSNWNKTYDGEITSTDCYAGCIAISNIDGVDLVLNEYTSGLDELPMAWGGYGFYREITSVYVVEVPNDNFMLDAIVHVAQPIDKVNIVVNWGDGIVTKGEISHTYSNVGRYVIKGHILFSGNGYSPSGALRQCLVEIIQLPSKPLGMGNAYNGCTKLRYVSLKNCTMIMGSTFINTSNSIKAIDVTGAKLSDISGLFSKLSGLTSIIGIENLDVSKVTSMSYLFNECSSLTFLDLSKWDTSKVTNMDSMFKRTGFTTTDNIIGLHSLNFENVENMNSMFMGSKINKLDTRGWNIKNLKTFSGFCNENMNLREIHFTFSGTYWSQLHHSYDVEIIGFHDCTMVIEDYVFPFLNRGVFELDMTNVVISDIKDTVNGGRMTNNRVISSDSLVKWLTALADRTSTTQGVCAIGSHNIAKLTPAQLAIATNKNWTVT